MANNINLIPVYTANDTFNILIAKVNNAISVLNSNTVLCDNSSGGIVTTGNVSINGYFTATNGSFEYLTGGNNTVVGNLNIGSYTVISPLGGSLGYLANSQANIANFYTSANGNYSILNFGLLRGSNGSGWTSASFRIQHIIDVTPMSYIDFNPYGNGYSLGFGQGTQEALRIDPSGHLYAWFNLTVNNSLQTSNLTATSFTNVNFFTANTISANTLTLYGIANVEGLTVQGNINAASLSISGNSLISGSLNVSSNVYISNILNVGGNSIFANISSSYVNSINIINQSNINTATLYVSSNLSVLGHTTLANVSLPTNINGNTTFNNNLSVDGTFTAFGGIICNNPILMQPSSVIRLDGGAQNNPSLTFTGSSQLGFWSPAGSDSYGGSDANVIFVTVNNNTTVAFSANGIGINPISYFGPCYSDASGTVKIQSNLAGNALNLAGRNANSISYDNIAQLLFSDYSGENTVGYIRGDFYNNYMQIVGPTNQFIYMSSSGFIGIGNTTPTALLDISGNTALNNTLKIRNHGLVANQAGQIIIQAPGINGYNGSGFAPPLADLYIDTNSNIFRVGAPAFGEYMQYDFSKGNLSVPGYFQGTFSVPSGLNIQFLPGAANTNAQQFNILNTDGILIFQTTTSPLGSGFENWMEFNGNTLSVPGVTCSGNVTISSNLYVQNTVTNQATVISNKLQTSYVLINANDEDDTSVFQITGTGAGVTSASNERIQSNNIVGYQRLISPNHNADAGGIINFNYGPMNNLNPISPFSFPTDQHFAYGLQLRANGEIVSYWDGLATYQIPNGNVSDERIKKNIKDFNYDPYEKIDNLKVRTFEFKDYHPFANTGERVGFIAQEIQKVIPTAVMDNKSINTMFVDRLEIIPYLVQYVKALKSEIELLKNGKS